MNTIVIMQLGHVDIATFTPRLGWSALFVELKTPKGRQSGEQLRFAAYCVKHGYMYALARNIDEFRGIVNNYMQGEMK